MTPSLAPTVETLKRAAVAFHSLAKQFRLVDERVAADAYAADAALLDALRIALERATEAWRIPDHKAPAFAVRLGLDEQPVLVIPWEEKPSGKPWMVFCPKCDKRWLVFSYHAGSELCADCAREAKP